MGIEVKKINTGYWIKIKIISVSEGFTQVLKDGKWINSSLKPERFEEEILTLGKHFDNFSDADDFINTKSFKSLFKNIEKNFK